MQCLHKRRGRQDARRLPVIIYGRRPVKHGVDRRSHAVRGMIETAGIGENLTVENTITRRQVRHVLITSDVILQGITARDASLRRRPERRLVVIVQGTKRNPIFLLTLLLSYTPVELSCVFPYSQPPDGNINHNVR